MSTVPADGPPPPPLGQVVGFPRGGPTALRIMLGAQLRRLRENSDISTHDAGRAIRASHSKISRMELGRVGFKQRDVGDLLTLYGVTSVEERRAMLSLVREANTPGWWHQFGDVLPQWFEVYIGLEQAARLIRAYEVQFVPGLLQTADYARAVIKLGHPHATAEELDRRVDMRLTRQHRLLRADELRMWAVVDEAALRRPLGGVSAMRAQLEHLIELNLRDNVTLQVVPFHAGGHAAAGGPFSIMRFTEDSLSDVVYLEQLTSALYLERPNDVDHYRKVMDRLCVKAQPALLTTDLLTSLLKDL